MSITIPAVPATSVTPPTTPRRIPSLWPHYPNEPEASKLTTNSNWAWMAQHIFSIVSDLGMMFRVVWGLYGGFIVIPHRWLVCIVA